MVAKKTAVAVPAETKKSTAVVSWRDKMAQKAKQIVEREKAPAGSFVSVRAGQLQYANQPCADNKLDAVIGAFIFENALYDEDFDPDDPKSPICFAFAENEDDLKPHPDSEHPQHPQCDGCPMNKFGTAEKGKGKACKNIRRLALLPAKPLNAEAISKTDGAILKLPVTSVKTWARYAHELDTLYELPPMAVVTQISTVPDPKTQFKITLTHMANIMDDEVLEAISNKEESLLEMLKVPYQKNEDKEEAPKKPATKKPAAKKKY